jgi:hypothetical protein
VRAFGDYLAEVRAAMVELACRYEPVELNRIGFRLYEKFRPDVPYGAAGWAAKAVLDVDKIRAARNLLRWLQRPSPARQHGLARAVAAKTSPSTVSASFERSRPVVDPRSPLHTSSPPIFCVWRSTKHQSD